MEELCYRILLHHKLNTVIGGSFNVYKIRCVKHKSVNSNIVDLHNRIITIIMTGILLG